MAQTKPKAGQFYGVSNNGTDGQFLQTDGAGGMAWAATITDPTITSIDYPGSATAADPAGGQSVIINGTLFASGITCTVGGTSAVTAFNSATQITITTPAKAAGPYAIAVANPDGGTASETNFIQYSGVPVWSTAAGTLGNVMEGEAASFQVTATEGSDTIEYAVTTGTLPTGLSLATATGAITGTAPTVSADTTTTFSITATDDENQTSASRSFSITVQNNGPSNHFNTVLYNGTNAAQSISSLKFSPGLVWIKVRNTIAGSNWHELNDIVRGQVSRLYSNSTSSAGTVANGFVSIDSNGFSLNGTGGGGEVNGSGGNYVAWNFKAGGAAVANTNGTINSNVSVNNTLGFSIVSYTGNGVQGATVGHGLDATPDLIIAKGIGNTGSWRVGVTSLGWQYYMNLDGTPGANVASSIWNSTTPTSSVFSLGNNPDANGSNQTKIAYCFTSKPGFSKVGSYTGNGSANGTIVETGFEPAWLMTKRTDVAGYDWYVWDNKRSPSNPRNEVLRPNSSSAEVDYSAYPHDFYSNGFAVNTNNAAFNASGGTYIYLAIAADGSTATPSLANSFTTELYTGTGSGSKTVTGVGFRPDLVWGRSRTGSIGNILFDVVRGENKQLSSDNNSAEVTRSSAAYEFENDGFTVTTAGNLNNSVNYASWNWKAGGVPSINTDGTITSIVSANQAAGFSIVSYIGTGSTATVGHGLNSPPELILAKVTSLGGYSWACYSETTGINKILQLNVADATVTYNNYWGAVSPTNNVFGVVNGSYNNNATGQPIIAYCFTSISGYSKVGTYNGSGSAGNAQNVGFQPDFLLLKATNVTSNWSIYDSKRGGDNRLIANSTAAESVLDSANFTSTGFEFTDAAYNNTGETYIYLAIKEN